MKFARGFLIFCYGLFTIAAQTLLFRCFLTTFEGNDISVGIFFGCWFLWVGLGALFISKTKFVAEAVLKNIELMPLIYLPAFIIELFLIIQARQLAGIESYALLSIRTIVLLSLIVSAPVSFTTGMLFPLLCRWIQQDRKPAVSTVYILEAAGSLVGGLAVTLSLAFGASPAGIFLALAFILSLSVSFAQSAKVALSSGLKIKTCPAFLVPLFILLCFAAGLDTFSMRYLRVLSWSRLLPKEAFVGSFQTAQAQYLYGNYQGQWIAVRQGGVCEALPDQSGNARTAAIVLCQNPNAKKVLIIGSGPGLCRQFLHLPQLEDVTWTHYDGEYVQRLGDFLPPELKISDSRFNKLTGDIRPFLAAKVQYYDIVVLNLPDATNSVLNRYYTLEFYNDVKASLRSGGLLAVRTTAGENIMGTELINLGASIKLTLEQVFSGLVLVPGEQSWFIASDSNNLTGNPGTLRDRFALIKSGPDIFSPDALLSIYLPDRAAAALESYASADLPDTMLINRDSRPLTCLYSLLLTAKQSDAPVTQFVKHLAVASLPAFLVPVLVFMVLSVFYVAKSPRPANPSGFESTFLVFSAGLTGIAAVIVLMYLYQTRYGSLYLHIGLISSLFMVGLTIGAILIRGILVSAGKTFSQLLLLVVIVFHTLILTAISIWPAQQYTHLLFALAFVLSGLCTGGYFPLAAKQLADYSFDTGRAAGRLEAADHLGASVGGLLTSLLLVPLLGSQNTLIFLIFLLLANVPLVALKMAAQRSFSLPAAAPFKLRRLGFLLFGIAISVILTSNLLARSSRQLTPSLPLYTAQALAGQSHLEHASKLVADKSVNYFELYDTSAPAADGPAAGKLTGYVFSSQDLAPDIRGFGGALNIALYTDAEGTLINFHIIRSNETPSYLNMLSRWFATLNSRNLFGPAPFDGVHAVTGATVSSEAVLAALQVSARSFAAEVLGRPTQTETAAAPRPAYLPDKQGVYLIAVFAVALLIIYNGGFWTRLVLLSFNLLIGGIILNAQYSNEQTATILSLHYPAPALKGAFLLAAAVPLLVILFGNIYCGYICPFGAAQELLSYITPRRFRQTLSKPAMQKARFVKYIVLFVLVIVFFLSRDRSTIAADPLIWIFSPQLSAHGPGPYMTFIIAVILLGSFFFTRFWCRYLCPAGAFLSLLSRVSLFKRYFPAKRFSRCEFGLTAADHSDCIYCDRCRPKFSSPADEKIAAPFIPPAPSLRPAAEKVVTAAILIIAVFISAVSVNRFFKALPASLSRPAVSAASGGKSQDVDLQRIRKMIEQNRLSDHKAEFYKKTD